MRETVVHLLLGAVVISGAALLVWNLVGEPVRMWRAWLSDPPFEGRVLSRSKRATLEASPPIRGWRVRGVLTDREIALRKRDSPRVTGTNQTVSLRLENILAVFPEDGATVLRHRRGYWKIGGWPGLREEVLLRRPDLA